MAIPKKPAVPNINDFIDGAKATAADTHKKDTSKKASKKDQTKVQEPEDIQNFRLPRSLIKKIKVYAALEDKDLKVLAREVFEAFFKNKVVPGVDN